jgi:hypothetical protein
MPDTELRYSVRRMALFRNVYGNKYVFAQTVDGKPDTMIMNNRQVRPEINKTFRDMLDAGLFAVVDGRVRVTPHGLDHFDTWTAVHGTGKSYDVKIFPGD